TESYTLSLHDALPILRHELEIECGIKASGAELLRLEPGRAELGLHRRSETQHVADGGCRTDQVQSVRQCKVGVGKTFCQQRQNRSEEHTSELQSLRHL